MTNRNIKAKPAVMWAITSPLPDGRREIIQHVMATRHDAISYWVDPLVGARRDEEWRYWRRKGYRCVKVRVTEI